MIAALIFDLDNCLAAANEIGDHLFAPAFQAINEANNGRLSEELLQVAFAECWRHPLDWVADKFGFSDEMRLAGWKVFLKTEATQPMRGYGDLNCLRELDAKKFLVTSGFQALQQSKIRALGIENLFTAIFIDAIDQPHRIGKQGLFEKILKEYHLSPGEVLVVGDNADSEIAAGNRLGIRTVQTLRPGVPRTDTAQYHIESLEELKHLLV